MKVIHLWIGTKKRTAQPRLAFLVAFVLAMVVTPSALPVIAQQPSDDNGTDAPKSDAISGRVVNEKGEPIANATVVARAFGVPGLDSRSTNTDSEGNFRVIGLEPRAYQLFAYAPAYAAASRDPAPDQPSYYRVGDSVRLEMMKGGVITGTVTTSAGEPVVAAPVRAYMIRGGNGQLSRYGMRPQQWITDDRGVYRIYGLPAGTYVVAAGGSGSFSSSNYSNAYETDTPTYAPSSARNNAREIVLGVGEEAAGVDIRYRGEPGFTISGRVLDPKFSAGPSGFAITLSSINASDHLDNLSTYQSVTSQGFTLHGVADGDYLITALTAQSYSAGELAVSESRRIKVRGADLTGIELTTRPLGSITGRIALEGSKATDCKGKRQPIFSETLITPWQNDKERNNQPPFLWALRGPSMPKQDGAFALRNLASGQYRLNAKFFARYWYLRSMTLPASSTPQEKVRSADRLLDAARNWITVKPGDRISGLVITLAEGAASFHGQVKTAEGLKQPPLLSIFLVPAERESAEDVLRFFAIQTTDGTFAINNLPPGRYRALARPAAESEPDLQSKLRLPDHGEARAKLRQETEAAKAEIDLKPCQNVTNYSVPMMVP